MVDANVERQRHAPVAEDYLNFVYTDEAQEIIAKNHYRPTTTAGIAGTSTTRRSSAADRSCSSDQRTIAAGWDERQTRRFSPMRRRVRRTIYRLEDR